MIPRMKTHVRSCDRWAYEHTDAAGIKQLGMKCPGTVLGREHAPLVAK